MFNVVFPGSGFRWPFWQGGRGYILRAAWPRSPWLGGSWWRQRGGREACLHLCFQPWLEDPRPSASPVSRGFSNLRVSQFVSTLIFVHVSGCFQRCFHGARSRGSLIYFFKSKNLMLDGNLSLQNSFTPQNSLEIFDNGQNSRLIYWWQSISERQAHGLQQWGQVGEDASCPASCHRRRATRRTTTSCPRRTTTRATLISCL